MQQQTIIGYLQEKRRTDKVVILGIAASYLSLAIFFATKITFYKELHYISLVTVPVALLLSAPLASRTQRRDVLIGFVIILMMAVNGILRQNFISYYLQDLVAFSMLTFILVFNRSNSDAFPLVLINLFSRLLFIGAIVFTISLLNTKFILTTTRFERSSAISYMIFNPSETITLVHFAPLLVFFYRYLTRMQIIVALLSCLAILTFGFLTATRVTIVIALFPILYYIWARTRTNLLRFALLAALIFLPLILVYFTVSDNPIIRSTILRFEISENYTSYRTDEYQGFVRDFKPEEFMLGRGLGGAHYYGIWKDFSHIYGMNMAHFGFLHLFLKGGLILLIFIYFLDIRAIVRLISRRNQDPLAVPFLFVILLFVIYEISHTRFLDNYYLIFLFSAISYSLNPNEAAVD